MPPDRVGAGMMTGLRVGGFQPFTTLDFPGQLAAVVFCQGCPLRCIYCHNRDLLEPARQGRVDWADIITHLERRRGLLEAVVFSGGEPLLQAGLGDAIDEVRALGYRIGLHTAGTSPDRLSRLLDRVDWVGFDLKAPFDAYEGVTGVAGIGSKVRRAYQALVASGVPHEVRTTLWPDRVGAAQVRAIASVVEQAGGTHFVLQQSRHPETGEALTSDAIADTALLSELADRFEHFQLRRAA